MFHVTFCPDIKSKGSAHFLPLFIQLSFQNPFNVPILESFVLTGFASFFFFSSNVLYQLHAAVSFSLWSTSFCHSQCLYHSAIQYHGLNREFRPSINYLLLITGPTNRQTTIHIYTNSESLDNLTCTSVDWEREQEFPEETHRHMERT